MTPRIAVIGGGIFGCTAAVELARAGAVVELFEARWDILDGASDRNQARLHRGYHYPRSDATATVARDAAAAFEARYFSAVRRYGGQHYYVIAPGSKTTPEQYLAFCNRLGLPYEVVDPPPHVHTSELCVRVSEAFIDVAKLRRCLRGEIARAGVALHLGERAEPEYLAGYDWIVQATYGQPWPAPLRYEVCEVALLQLGRYSGDSFVVLDGEFVSLDPHGPGLYALYDVAHSVHAVSPNHLDLPEPYGDLIRRGTTIAPGPPLSNLPAMLASASRFLWGLDPGSQGVSIYQGSMWSLRAVLPNVDGTDERPTLIDRDGNLISVLGGKMCTAVTAARSVTEMALGLVPA